MTDYDTFDEYMTDLIRITNILASITFFLLIIEILRSIPKFELRPEGVGLIGGWGLKNEGLENFSGPTVGAY